MTANAPTSREKVAALPLSRPLVDVSLWSADLTRLGSEIARVAPLADLFHLDVADGHFTPQLLFFPDLVAALRPGTEVPFHVHLMVDEPIRSAASFAEAGADLITVHVETGEQVRPALRAIHSVGRATGLALTLDTPVTAVLPYLGELDAIVLIGTPLGTRGTEAAEVAAGRVTAVRQLVEREVPGRALPILADGGIRRQTVGPLLAAGADGVVAGSLVFGGEVPPEDAVAWIRGHERRTRIGWEGR